MSLPRLRVQTLLAAIVAEAALAHAVVLPWRLAGSDSGRSAQEPPTQREADALRLPGSPDPPGSRAPAPRARGAAPSGEGPPEPRAGAGRASPGAHGASRLGERGHLRRHGSTFKKVKPLIRIPGNVSRWQHPLNLVEELCFHKQLGGSFSLMCTLQLEQIAPWQRVFDFSFAADIDSITAGALSNTSHLHFTIFKGQKKSTVKVWDFFEPGKRITALFTVNSSGRMRVWKNGELAAEIDGHAPYFNDRPHLMIGGHYLYKKQFFHGVIGNVKIWSKEVVWPPAPGMKPASLARQLGGGVSVGGPPPLPRPPRIKRLPRATTTALPAPALHSWSRILTDDREQESHWDQPRRVMMIPTTTPNSRFHYSDPSDDEESQQEGPPLPKPPPQQWPQIPQTAVSLNEQPPASFPGPAAMLEAMTYAGAPPAGAERPAAVP